VPSIAGGRHRMGITLQRIDTDPAVMHITVPSVRRPLT
jgi:hypothetical protein